MKRSGHSSDPNQPVADALDRLRDELAVVRQVLDDILVEIQWANRNRSAGDEPIVYGRRITSMPVDPCASDWGERLNRYSPADVPIDDSDEPSAEPGSLF